MRSVYLTALAAAGVLAFGSAALADGVARVVGTPEDSGIDDQRIICKKHLETGSLVRKAKRCFTKTEWARISESEQTGTRRMVDELQTRPNAGGGN